jgi:plasmid stability protein
MQRISLVLEDALLERLRARARSHRTTLSDEVRAILKRDVDAENPNEGLVSLLGSITELRPGPELESEEFREMMARQVEKKLEQEPDRR